jgi:hypothetical protein
VGRLAVCAFAVRHLGVAAAAAPGFGLGTGEERPSDATAPLVPGDDERRDPRPAAVFVQERHDGRGCETDERPGLGSHEDARAGIGREPLDTRGNRGRLAGVAELPEERREAFGIRREGVADLHVSPPVRESGTGG